MITNIINKKEDDWLLFYWGRGGREACRGGGEQACRKDAIDIFHKFDFCGWLGGKNRTEYGMNL